MLPANLISALQALSNSGKPLTTAATDAPRQVTNLEPGQQVQGSVQAKISEGMFKVQVAGQTLQMRLPGNIQSGDVIRLEVIATQPRITFGMVASTNPLSTPEQIGSTARMLGNLAELPLERQIVQQPGSKAVWQPEQTAPDTRQLAGALRETLGKSGLFYESHQAQWVRGERSINQLLEEPQNLLTGKVASSSGINPQSASGAYSASSPAGSGLPAGGAGPGAEKLLAGNPQGTPANQVQTDGMTRSAGDIPLPIAKELLHLVQQQLHTLENHHLVWMGQVWPGQQMQWEVQGEPEQQREQPDERQWSTEMELALPNLGDVRARLVFSASGLRLTLHAADTMTVELFNSALPQLRNSLADADIALLAAAVEKS